MTCRPPDAAATFDAIAKRTGIPRSTAFRDVERFRDLLTLEIVFNVLPRHVQQKWLRSKLGEV